MSLLSRSGKTLSVTLIALFPAINAQAGLFDFLNQGGTLQPQQRTIERPEPAILPPLQMPVPQLHAEPHRRITIVRPEKHEKLASLGTQAADLSQTTRLLKDKTLRDGDAVMTQHGVRIYASAPVEGLRGELVPLSQTKGLSPAERTALVEIDARRSNDGPVASADQQSQLVTGRSAATEHPWKWVRDPKGQLVRYVGP